MQDKKEYLEFMAAHEEPNQKQAEQIQALQRTLAKPPLFKITTYQIIACAFTLLICPQFGFGALLWGENIVHHIFHQSPLLCGAYCGFMYLGISSLLTSLSISRAELTYLVTHRNMRLVLASTMLFSITLLAQVTLGSLNVDASYFVSWLVVGMLSAYYLQSCALTFKERYA